MAARLRGYLQCFASGSTELQGDNMSPIFDDSSNKDAKYENFPVGSWLLSNTLRHHIICFYNFARYADNIADNPILSPKEKLKLLDDFEDTLMGKGEGDPTFQKAIDMHESLKKSGISHKHCRDLLCAFKQDAIKSRYDDWTDLVDYCALSAAPVGRYMLDLHGEHKLAYGKSDSLCLSLQLINHLQDCGDDYQTLNRVYLPMNWVNEAGLDLIDLGRNQTTIALRRVIDWMLIGINGHLDNSRPLPINLQSLRLSLETSIIYQIAQKLFQKIKENDPLSKRIELSKSELAKCSFMGLASGLLNKW